MIKSKKNRTKLSQGRISSQVAIALLTMPAATSGQFVKDMKKMMVLASCLGTIFTTVGLWLSYFLNLTFGATIILVAGAVYLLSVPISLC